MKRLIIYLGIILIFIFLISPIILGVLHGCGGYKYIYPPEKKIELLIEYKQLIKDGNVIQGFPYNGWFVSYYPITNSTWFFPKIYDFFYKWSVYYNFKWWDIC